MDPPEKFTPSRFMLYDGKSDPRSHVSHVRQIMALWNHMNALMCLVFHSSLRDFGLKWFDKLLVGSIESFHQLTKSFVARFLINTKALKGFGSILTLWKAKNKSIRNYRKRYWETYNEIEECSEELTCGKLQARIDSRGETLEELNAPIDLDLMFRMAMKEVQLIDEEHEVLKDVGRNPEAKVVEDLILYELDELSSNRFFLTEPNFIKHEFNILPDARPVKQRGRRSTSEHVDVVIEEVEKLKETSEITKVLYPSWLSNTIVVLADFMVKFLPKAVSPEQGCLVSTHRGEESSEAVSSVIQSIPVDKEVIQEPPQHLETTASGEIFDVPEVIEESPQIGPTSA
ncbi:hypothetical protein Acr_28g0005160 [Actinidia rufa]|uniref:Uncharacterized protein n=1 Tax=Actinidia rufa TaxID=165716 RepID=A0A7J0HA26_9ERIC|nr:hypothetical protein Acr_28g0005160 [Actinidia rufa]